MSCPQVTLTAKFKLYYISNQTLWENGLDRDMLVKLMQSRSVERPQMRKSISRRRFKRVYVADGYHDFSIVY